MSVYKSAKSSNWQYDFQLHGRRFHGSTGCTTRRDAERFEAGERRRAALGEKRKPDITVDEACGTWWLAKGQHQKSSATSRYQLNNLIDGLGKGKLLADLALIDFDRYVARRRADVADASVNREVQLARRVFRHADDRGFDVPAIAWGKLILKEPKERVRELSGGEERDLFDRLPADLAAVVEFAMLSGQRRTSIITMLWSKVDLPAGRATVRVKGDHWHTFPLSPRMVAIIANQLPKIGAQVFSYTCERTAPAKGKQPRRIKGDRYPFSLQGWTRKWRKALADAGVEDFRFHDLRHTAATRVLRATGNLKVVQRLLDHADIATTARYAHALEDDVRNALLATESRNSPGASLTNASESGGNLRRLG